MLRDLPNKYYPDADVPRVSGQAFINSPHAQSHTGFSSCAVGTSGNLNGMCTQ